MRNKLSEEQINQLRTSFDIIGDIAIIEVPEELESKKNDIVEALLKVHPGLKTICRKLSARQGKLRLRDMEILYGNNTETIHVEYGFRLHLDVRKVYFSPRESTERQRIAGMVKPGEIVLVMFAGIGPYAIAIAKRQPNVEKVYAIEVNPDAYRYMEENIRINKLSHKIVPIFGDVKEKCKELAIKFDRIVMPLPKEGYKFLDIAIMCLKPGGILHFYFCDSEKNLFEKAVSILRESAYKSGRKIRVLSKRKVLPYGPRVWKICVDAKIE